jgi:DNA (cytosine-5)-methyltransferase 1
VDDSDNESPVRPIFEITDSDSEDEAGHFRPTQALRNPPVQHPLQIIFSYDIGEFNLRPGKSVELKRKDNEKDRFLRIHQIIRHVHDNSIYLRGHLFFRTRTLRRMLKHQRNEIYRHQELDRDDLRPAFIQSMYTFPLDAVKKIRTIIITDERFPRHSFREQGTRLDQNLPGYEEQKNIIRENDVLVCRTFYCKKFDTAAARLNIKKPCYAGSLLHVKRDDADERYRSEPRNKEPRNKEPRNEKPSRAFKARSSISNQPQSKYPRKKRIYTSGSGFAGGGGDLTGTKLAGVRVKWAWDEDEHACKTLGHNHPTTRVYRVRANEFFRPDHGGYVDIYHISPPCQYFSPAHTKEGGNDDENIAALYVIQEHLKHIKPRIVTMENTFGLAQDAKSAYFEDGISLIYDCDYDVHWQVDDFRKFGLPANRKRLVVIGAR